MRKIIQKHLKKLLADVSEFGFLNRGIFVPAGLHLMEGKEVVTNIHQAHAELLNTIKATSLCGINAWDINKSIDDGK